MWVPEEVGNGVISDHEMWVWSKFIHGVCHSHRIGTEEIRRIEQVVSVYLSLGVERNYSNCILRMLKAYAHYVIIVLPSFGTLSVG